MDDEEVELIERHIDDVVNTARHRTQWKAMADDSMRKNRKVTLE